MIVNLVLGSKGDMDQCDLNSPGYSGLCIQMLLPPENKGLKKNSSDNVHTCFKVDKCS